MKKFLLVALLCLANQCFGLEYNGCFDDANLLKPETVASIQSIGKKLYDEGRVQFTVKVVEDCKDTLLDGREFFNTTGIGDKEKNNGLLLFVNAKNFRANKPNKIRLLTGYGLEGLFTDSLCGRILDQGLEQKGSDAKILEIVNLVNSEFEKLGDSPIPEKNKKLDKMLSVVGIVFIIIFVIVVIVFVLSEGDGTSSGGCGGGYDGGSGFSGGGFGGGSCGGGGAGR